MFRNPLIDAAVVLLVGNGRFTGLAQMAVAPADPKGVGDYEGSFGFTTVSGSALHASIQNSTRLGSGAAGKVGRGGGRPNTWRPASTSSALATRNGGEVMNDVD